MNHMMDLRRRIENGQRHKDYHVAVVGATGAVGEQMIANT